VNIFQIATLGGYKNAQVMRRRDESAQTHQDLGNDNSMAADHVLEDNFEGSEAWPLSFSHSFFVISHVEIKIPGRW